MSPQPAFTISPEMALRIHWSKRGSCGESGCIDPDCCCSFCAKPIGIPENDPRRDMHDEENCFDLDCPICVDRVPLILWRGEGKNTEQAQFHDACFRQMMNWIPR